MKKAMKGEMKKKRRGYERIESGLSYRKSIEMAYQAKMAGVINNGVSSAKASA